jgi:dTDP-glucose 4,6-dehydratase
VRTVVAEALVDVAGLPEVAAAISLAGQTNVDVALRHPAAAFDANLRIAIDLGEWLRRGREDTQLIYMSSDEVLGETRVALPEDAVLRPTQPYAASKAAAEVVLHNYRDVYALNVTTLRSCNLVGGSHRAKKLVPVAARRIATARAVPIYGDGAQMREWMAVEDLASAILLLLGVPSANTVFQAATGVHLSVNEVVALVGRALNRSVRTARVRDRMVHDRCYAMSSARLRERGWKPRIDPRIAIMAAAREIASRVSSTTEYAR